MAHQASLILPIFMAFLIVQLRCEKPVGGFASYIEESDGQLNGFQTKVLALPEFSRNMEQTTPSLSDQQDYFFANHPLPEEDVPGEPPADATRIHSPALKDPEGMKNRHLPT